MPEDTFSFGAAHIVLFFMQVQKRLLQMVPIVLHFTLLPLTCLVQFCRQKPTFAFSGTCKHMSGIKSLKILIKTVTVDTCN